MATSLKFEKEAFAELVSSAHGCQLCPEMAGCQRVLSDANGPSDAPIMFIGEAPGRLGAERTAIPFHGDVAGDNFERLLALSGLSRAEVFVTNSILCNPTDAKGNNAPPSKKSVKNCSVHLKSQIDVINPKLVVTLGAAALNALSLISEHFLSVSSGVRTKHDWYGRTLIPLYHPGARAMIHRNFAAQTADYYFVGETFRRLNSVNNRRSSPKPNRSGWQFAKYVMSKLQRLSLFRLHKVMYLSDCVSFEMRGEKLTDFFYIRQKDGPYCVELGSRWYKNFPNVLFSMRSGIPSIEWLDSGLFSEDIEIPAYAREIIDRILEDVSHLTDSQLKTRAYLTRPMKAALRAERAGLIGLNRALLR